MGQSAIATHSTERGATDFFSLTLEAGVHAGVVQRLASGCYAIGRDLNADLVLADPSLEARHAIVSLAGGRVRVRAIDGAVNLPGQRRLSPGQQRRFSLPVELSMGETRMRLTAPARRDRLGWRTALLGLAVLCGGIIIPIGTESSFSSLASRTSVAAAEVAIAAPAPIVPPALTVESGEGAEALRRAVQATVSAAISAGAERGGQLAAIEAAPDRFRLTGFVPTAADRSAIEQMLEGRTDRINLDLLAIDEVAEELGARLAAAGLADAVRVAPGFGTITVDGVIDPALQPSWQLTQAWFDQRFAQRIVMVCNVAISDEDSGPRLTIEAVWVGAHPYVVAADGRRYGEGAALDNGWQLDRIEADRLLISRGGQQLALTF